MDAATLQSQNMSARAAIVTSCPTVVQKIATVTQANYPYTSGQATTINIPLQNVGLIKKLWLRCQMNVKQGAAETQTLTTLGPANFLSQVILTDLNNLTRINTTGWHLNFVSTARRQFPFGAAITSDNPTGFGSNYNLIKAPSSVTTAQNAYMFYEVPLTYSDTDLRGGIFANVVNATMNLQLTVNPNLFVTSTGDPVSAMYQSSTAQLGVLQTYQIDVYQEYYDQLPRDGSGAYQLPLIDLATQYNLVNIGNTGLAANTDQTLAYANFRSYLSTCVIYDNGGVLNAGSDINYFSLATANAMMLFKYDPFVAQFTQSRVRFNDDFPKGCYYFDHRARPLTTLAFGNMALNVNPSAVSAGAQLLVGYEYMSLQNQLQQAGSIQSS